MVSLQNIEQAKAIYEKDPNPVNYSIYQQLVKKYNEEQKKLSDTELMRSIPPEITQQDVFAINRYVSIARQYNQGKLSETQAQEQLQQLYQEYPEAGAAIQKKAQEDWAKQEQAKGNIVLRIEKELAQQIGSESDEQWQIVSLDKSGQRYLQAYREAQNFMKEVDKGNPVEQVIGRFRFGVIHFDWDIIGDLNDYNKNPTPEKRQRLIEKIAQTYYGEKVLKSEGGVGFAKFFLQSPAGLFGTSVATGMGFGALASVAPKTATAAGLALTGYGAHETVKAVQKGEIPVWKAVGMTAVGAAGGITGFKSTIGIFKPYVFKPKSIPAKINLAIETGIEKTKLIFYKPLWKTRSWLIQRKMTPVPREQLARKSLWTGELRYGTTSKGVKETIRLFELSKTKPGVIEPTGAPRGYHATPYKFFKLSRIKPGASETPGISVSPETVPHFLGYEKIYSYPSNVPIKARMGLLPKLRWPRFSMFEFKKGIFRIPSKFKSIKSPEKYYKLTGKYILKQPKGKWAVVAPKQELGGGEMEVIIPSKTWIWRGKAKYYVDVPTKIGEFSTPIEPTPILSKGTPTGLKQVVSSIKMKIPEIVSPSIEPGQLYYSLASPSVYAPLGLTSIPSRPSKPSMISIPSAPYKPSRPSYPSKPTKLSIPSKPYRPSYPSYPSYPSFPSVPSAPSIPSIPSTPSFPSVPSIPSFPTRPVPPYYIYKTFPKQIKKKKKRPPKPVKYRERQFEIKTYNLKAVKI